MFLSSTSLFPVSIIPPLLHTHSFIYHPHCKMFLSQYFSFLLSVSFHLSFTLIYSSTTDCKIFLSQNFCFFCQYHFTIAPYSFFHLPPIMYNIFFPALQISPVTIIPPFLLTHSFIYHPLCVMFFSHYFSFPLSVSFHHCSTLIHSSTTQVV